MTGSNGRAKRRYAALVLAVLVAGCAADQAGVVGLRAPAENRSLHLSDAHPTNAAPVNLGAAGNFAILAKSGISTVPQSVVTGNIGVSPIARGGITGFSEIMDLTNTFSTSTQVVGQLFAADYSSPSPANLGAAVLDMQAA